MLNNFGEYMFFLLTTPLRKAKKALNQFRIFFQVTGKLFDDCKQDIFRMRQESIIATASEVMLDVHGQDRGMVRLKGETAEGYRTRLMMKAIIAEKAGSKEGILLALASMGYELSRIEPFYEQDPDRWAEFIVFMRSSNPSSVNDVRVIDSEVMSVKQVSSKPAYGAESVNRVRVYSADPAHDVCLPLCGVTLCGVWPDAASYGISSNSGITVNRDVSGAAFEYPMTGRVQSSETFYREAPVPGIGTKAKISLKSAPAQEEAPYPMTGKTVASEKFYISGEE